MRGCTCRGLTLCEFCTQLAQRAGVLAPAQDAPAISEKAFMGAVVRLAREQHYLVYHTYTSKRSPEGFPDLVMVDASRCDSGALVWFVELKTAEGQVTPAQQAWLTALDGRETAAAIWRPEDWSQIVAALRR